MPGLYCFVGNGHGDAMVFRKVNDTHAGITENGSANGKTSLMKGYLLLLGRVVLIAVIGVIVFTKVFLITQMNGNGMFPALRDGDLIVAFRLQGGFAKNDVVVYSCGGERYVGRIAALERDTVMIDDSGILTVNGTEQIGEILFPTYADGGLSFPFTVPDGCVFVLGDHRTDGGDSREKGAVSLESIEGKVITLLRRRGI